jgi:cbb3-type cytochrome oxidase subunit 1
MFPKQGFLPPCHLARVSHEIPLAPKGTFMTNIAKSFLLAAVLAALCGMGLGIFMAASQDHTLGGAHAHLNLVGWVSLALFGFYYALTPQATGRLARIHLALSVMGAVVMPIGIAMAILKGQEILAIIGSLLVLAGMLIFALTVLRHGVGRGQ